MGIMQRATVFTRIAFGLAREEGLSVMLRELHRTYVKRFLPDKTRFLPTSAEFEITTYCNLNCIMCRKTFEISENLDRKHMDMRLLETLLERLPFIELISLCGAGEPILHPRITEVAEKIKGSNRKLSIFTNGMTMDASLARELVRIPVDEIIFSIDAARQETYEPIRAGGNIDRVIANLAAVGEEIRKSGSETRLSVMTLLMDSNYKEFPEILRRVNGTGARALVAKHFNSGFNSGLRHMMLTQEQCEEFRVIFRGLPKTDMDVIYANDAYLMEPHHTSCTKAWESPFISVDGNLSICPFTYYRQNIDYGNLAKEHFMTVWNGKEIKEHRRRFREGDILEICEECPVSDLWRSQSGAGIGSKD